MTMTSLRPATTTVSSLPVEPREAPAAAVPRATSLLDAYQPPSSKRAATLVCVWVVVAITGMGLVLYGLEPLFQQRDQRLLLAQYRVELSQAANEAEGLPGVQPVTKAPEAGAAVGVIEIGPIQVQQVAVEGVSPSQTQRGPGHVPGTAGLGQPGNAVVVGRRTTYGGALGQTDQLHQGDEILVTTRQGQSVYKVASVRDHTIVAPDPTAVAAVAVPSSTGGTDQPPPDPLANDEVSVDDLYGKSQDDRLTLVTSASASPWNATQATVVIATLQGHPFAPTPQGGRTDGQTGLQGDASAWAPLFLALLAYGASVTAAVVLYRRSSMRVAYLLTTAPILVFTVVVAETASRLLPAWS